MTYNKKKLPSISHFYAHGFNTVSLNVLVHYPRSCDNSRCFKYSENQGIQIFSTQIRFVFFRLFLNLKSAGKKYNIYKTGWRDFCARVKRCRRFPRCYRFLGIVMIFISIRKSRKKRTFLNEWIAWDTQKIVNRKYTFNFKLTSKRWIHSHGMSSRAIWQLLKIQ